MKTRWLGTIAVGAFALLGAGSAGAHDGYSGDTGGPPPPEPTGSCVGGQPLSFRDAASAIDAGWPGDTGGPPPLAESDATESTAEGTRVAAAPAAGCASRSTVAFTDRG